MKSLFCIILFSITLFSKIDAQSTELLKLPLVEVHDVQNHKLLFFARQVKTNGEAVINPSWQSSILLTSTQDTFPLMAWYNTALDEVMMLYQNNTYTLYPQKVQAIAIQDQVFIASEYQNKKEQSIGYFELLSEGKIQLLQKAEFTQKDAKKIRSKEMYTKNPFKSPIAQPFKIQTKALKALFPGQERLIKTHLKNSSTLKNRSDLIKIFNICNKAVR